MISPKPALRMLLDRVFAHRRHLRDSNSVLLTFDDGPHPTYSPAVLDRLQQFDAKALFFLIGDYAAGQPQVVTRILAEGHAIGNHSYAHDPANVRLRPYWRDARRCQQVLTDLAGAKPRYFRAPLGAYSLASLVVPVALGMRQVLWSVDADDWHLSGREQAIACGERLCRQIGAGDIVLLHDNQPYIADVLDVLLPHLRRQGFELAHALDALN